MAWRSSLLGAGVLALVATALGAGAPSAAAAEATSVRTSVSARMGLEPCEFAAHRGDHASATENGLGAFRRAVADHVTYVEMDVRTTRDGVLMLMHDPTIDRTTRSRGTVSAMRWRDLRTVRLDDGETVPSLNQVFTELEPAPVQAFVEIKSVPDRYLPRLYRRIQELGVDRVVVNSFDAGVLLRFKQAYPDVRTARDTASPVSVADATAYGGVMIDYHRATGAWLDQMAQAGIPVYAWTVDTSSAWTTLRGKVDVIITNRPRAFELYRRSHCPAA